MKLALDIHRLKSLLCASGLRFLHLLEVSPDRFEGVPFLFNLALGAYAVSAKDRQRRTPALNGMLKKKAPDYQRY